MSARDYQSWGVDALWEYFLHNSGNPIVAMPTGTGKSHIIAEAIQRALFQYRDTRALMLTHSKELIQQNFNKLINIWPNAPAGIFSAGIGLKQAHFPITYAGVKSVVSNEHLFGKIDLVFIDECDLVSDDESTEYRKCIAALMVVNPKLKVIGLTATPWRQGTGLLTDGDNALFTHIAVNMIEPNIFNWFFDQGYLSRLITKPTVVELDISDVKTVAGEFNKNQLERAVNKADITHAAILEAMEVAEGRRKWLVFCAGVQHAEDTAAIIESLGIPARAVHSKQNKGKKGDTVRDQNIEWFRSYTGSDPIAIVNSDILTVGFDDPFIDLIIILRPTKSSRLWVQMLGRGTRPAYAEGFDLSTQEGRLLAIANGVKPNCMVLDYARNVPRLGPINDPVIPKKKGGDGGSMGPPVKLCSNPLQATGKPCNTYNHASRKCCEVCGAEFPETINIDLKAGSHELTKPTEFPIIQSFDVEHITYTLFKGASANPMMRVRYFCGIKSFDEYVCIQHQPGTYPRKKAMDWWREATTRSGDKIPETVNEALDAAKVLMAPTHIDVHINLKYPAILRKCYDGSRFGTLDTSDPASLKAPQVDITNDRTHNVVTGEAAVQLQNAGKPKEVDYQQQWKSAANPYQAVDDDDIPF